MECLKLILEEGESKSPPKKALLGCLDSPSGGDETQVELSINKI